MTPERFSEQSRQMIEARGAFEQIGGNAVLDPSDGFQAALYRVNGERTRFLHVADTDPAGDEFQETTVLPTHIDIDPDACTISVEDPDILILRAQGLGRITLSETPKNLR